MHNPGPNNQVRVRPLTFFPPFIILAVFVAILIVYLVR